MQCPVLITLAWLVAACQPGDPRTHKPDVRRLAEVGETGPLIAALETTGKVDPRDLCQRTPVMFAAQFGRLETVNRLLGAGANVHLHDKGCHTAPMLAAGNGHAGVVKRLAEAGAAFTGRQITHGWTALI